MIKKNLAKYLEYLQFSFNTNLWGSKKSISCNKDKRWGLNLYCLLSIGNCLLSIETWQVWEISHLQIRNSFNIQVKIQVRIASSISNDNQNIFMLGPVTSCSCVQLI